MILLRQGFAGQVLPRPAGGVERWCGWVLTGVAVLTPLFAWLGPLAFAPLMGLAGLLCLPAARIGPREIPLAIMLLTALAWAAASTLWSAFRPNHPQDSVVFRFVLEIALYWSAWQGARRADAAGRRRALRFLAWGLALVGVIMLIEAVTGGSIYHALRDFIHDPIRPDLGRKNLAQGSFVVALLWPVAAAGGVRAGAPPWLALPMAAGAGVLAQLFLSDAPVLAIGLAICVGGLVWVWPRSTPKLLGLAAALLVIVTPLLILLERGLGLGAHLPLSWNQRLGYWIYAMERIGEHPWRGWGLDASRAFSPYIQLHPHNGALQIWLELGAVGGVLAALVWAFVFRRLAHDERSLVAAGAAGSAAVYFLFGAVNFGIWQEWWLALGALVALIAALGDAEEVAT